MQRILQEIQKLLAESAATKSTIDKLWLRFGSTVRETRKMQKLSLVELSNRVGLSKSQLHFIEGAGRTCNVATATKILNALK